MIRFFRILSAVSLGALVGCGYRAGDSAVPPFRTLAIEAVKNETYAPQLQAEIHRQIFDALSEEKSFRVVPEGGVARLRVVLSDYDRGIGAVNSRDTAVAASHVFTLKARITLTDISTGKVLVRDRLVSATLPAYSVSGVNRTESATQALLTRELARAVRDTVTGVW